MGKDTTALHALIAPTIEALGYELVGCIYHAQGRYGILRIYIDKSDGITVDDCERVSRQVSALLDVEDPIRGAYTLEVSSPGLDRPLLTREHFERFIGKKAEVRLQIPLDNRRHFKGIIKAVQNNEIILQVEDQEFVLPLDNIGRANLVAEMNLKKK